MAQTLLNIPFDKADALWMSYQTKVASFVNTHSGLANIGSIVRERPNYAAIKDYLDGKISLNELKAKKACK